MDDLVSISRRSACSRTSRDGRRRWRGASRRHCSSAITTVVLSAFLDNVTTVLMIVPVTLAICADTEKCRPVPNRRGDLRLQYRRHRDPDRRSARYPDGSKSASPPTIRLSPDAGDCDRHGGAGGNHSCLWGKDLGASHDAEAREMAIERGRSTSTGRC